MRGWSRTVKKNTARQARNKGQYVKEWVAKRDAGDVQRDYPIADKLPGWFFRKREVSNGAWIVEGTDLWGRQVSDSGSDENALLASCIAAAERINARLKSSN